MNIIASAKMWCEQPGTQLLIQKDDNQFLHLTIRCGHIEVKATLAQFRIENLVAVASREPPKCPNCGKQDMQLTVTRETKLGCLRNFIHCNYCGHERDA